MKLAAPTILLILGLIIHVAGGGVFSGGTLLAVIAACWLVMRYSEDAP